MRDDPEHRFQVAVATYFKYALPPDILWTATLNGAYLTINQRVRMKASGLRPGIADLLLVHNGRVLMLELKSKIGTLSADQKAYRDALGENYITAQTIEEVEGALIGWGITPRCEITKANRYVI